MDNFYKTKKTMLHEWANNWKFWLWFFFRFFLFQIWSHLKNILKIIQASQGVIISFSLLMRKLMTYQVMYFYFYALCFFVSCPLQVLKTALVTGELCSCRGRYVRMCCSLWTTTSCRHWTLRGTTTRRRWWWSETSWCTWTAFTSNRMTLTTSTTLDSLSSGTRQVCKQYT